MPKTTISNTPPYFIKLDVSTLPTEKVTVAGRVLWCVWCAYCEQWHYHGPAPGHREAHCHDAQSGYEETGYNLKPPEGWQN